MIIYLDVLLIKEMFFNFIIIFLTAKIINKKIKFIRLLLASLLGSLYSIFAILINRNLFYNTFSNFICATLMNLIAFEKEDRCSFLKNIIVFYLTTFVLGGLNLYTNNTSINVYMATLTVLCLIPLLIKQYKSKFKLDSYYGEIILNDQEEKLKVFIDTGNQLKTYYD